MHLFFVIWTLLWIIRDRDFSYVVPGNSQRWRHRRFSRWLHHHHSHWPWRAGVSFGGIGGERRRRCWSSPAIARRSAVYRHLRQDLALKKPWRPADGGASTGQTPQLKRPAPSLPPDLFFPLTIHVWTSYICVLTARALKKNSSYSTQKLAMLCERTLLPWALSKSKESSAHSMLLHRVTCKYVV